MADIKIEETNYKAFAMVLAYLFMLIAAIAIGIYGVTINRTQVYLPGFIISAIFFVGFMISIMKATREKVLLTITREGIIDNSSLGGIGFISFDDIQEFHIVNTYDAQAIGVVLKDLKSYKKEQTAVKRSMMKRNTYMNLPPIIIHLDKVKDMEPEDILSLLQKRLRDYSSLY